MPPKAKIPAPIDRPLSRAYLREFSGWSTAYSPGLSEPTSLRVMENVQINRDGSLRLRPGLRYLSKLPSGDPIDRDIVGTHEAFFLNDGSRAYLFAVRETGGDVGFRVLSFAGAEPEVVSLTAAGFSVPQTEAVVNFSAATSYVKYLQIDNKILALSDAGETMRLFYVGETKLAKRLYEITRPAWDAADKLTVMHPEAGWILGSDTTVRKNIYPNPSFELDTHWTPTGCTIALNTTRNLFGTKCWLVTATADSPRLEGMNRTTLAQGDPVAISAYFAGGATTKVGVQIGIAYYSAEGGLIKESWSQVVNVRSSGFLRATLLDVAPVGTVAWRPLIQMPEGVTGDSFYVDGLLIEKSRSIGLYFDGSFANSGGVVHSWEFGTPHQHESLQTYTPVGSTLSPETPTPNTLVHSSKAENTFHFAFFYTFANEVGESKPSQISQIKVQRGMTEWLWEKPNPHGEPNGNEVSNAAKAADQLAVQLPEAAFNAALAQGATEWRLYMMTWSDQDVAPVEAQLIKVTPLTSSSTAAADGWARITADIALGVSDTLPVPTADTLVNYSTPPSASQGLVASDRLVLVHDPSAAGVIRWTSNRTGEFLNFTAARGGGYKTLTSGNLYVPAAAKLWQNPESKDTITVLCLGVDGYSTSYYMGPAQVSSQSEAVTFMAFEETTATPGTVSPFGCEVLNNALYHPLENELMKSTASNYNINHKTMTEKIQNMWSALTNKQRIVSSQLDNRLYYIVHNPAGAPLEEGCWGNEVWVLDTAVENGSWSRWLVQAHSLRKLEVGGQLMMGVVRPDGIYGFDPMRSSDELVDAGAIVEAPIAWQIETNTQGANRAHDAWAHLQQATLTLGDFLGAVRWGVRGQNVHGRWVDVSKTTRSDVEAPADGLPWDFEDQLLIREDLREWRLYASAVADGDTVEPFTGQLNLVQYRYTPVSVNVGYEQGSIETFAYGRNEVLGSDAYTANGIPRPMVDAGRA